MKGMKDKFNYADITFDLDKMDVPQMKEVIKIMMRLMNHEHDRVTTLQDRVLELEMRIK